MSEFFSQLEKQNLSALEHKAGISRQALHNALKSHNMKLLNLNSVAKAMQFDVVATPLRTESNLLASLAKYGVPVAHTKDGTLSFAEVVQKALVKAREDGAYETFLPYLLATNGDKLEPLKLAAKAFEVNQVNVLGYFTEMANLFKPSAALEELLRLLAPAQNNQTEFLVLATRSNFPELFEKNQLALKWNLKVRGTVQDHLDRWEKWVQSPNNN